MTTFLQSADTACPLAQSFIVTNPSGAVLTAVGLFFYSKPTSGSIPVSIELRPIEESGFPSSRNFYPGTKVSKAPADVAVSTSFNGSSNETKFVFEDPIFIPPNTEVALVISTNANPNDYRIWAAEMGEYYFGSTTKRITTQPAVGSIFISSNNTTWTPEQSKDIAFKIYRAEFTNTGVYATVYPDVPPAVNLTPLDAIVQPISFTAGADSAQIYHPNHGFLPGDKVVLSGIDSDFTINGIKGRSVMGTRTILKTDPYGYTIELDSAADSTRSGGGLSVTATEQYVIDSFKLIVPKYTPASTFFNADGSFTTTKSYAGGQTPYQTTSNVLINLEDKVTFKQPHVIASQLTEDSSLDSTPSTDIKIRFNTGDKFVAPSFNITNASIEIMHNIIDFQDSAPDSDRNIITTIPFVNETSSRGGSSIAKHIARAVTLLDAATSIRVIVDANRPPEAQFTVWYRTTRKDDGLDLDDVEWTAFSKTSTLPNNSNYQDVVADENFFTFREYRFNVFDLPAFDTYQIKITMNSTNSTSFPRFRNLRTIATI